MVHTCSVYGCTNRHGIPGVTFFRFPKGRRKRRAWIKAINRHNWMPNEHSRICSTHFVDGWHSDDPTEIDYRPTLFKYKKHERSPQEIAREDRRCKRSLIQDLTYETEHIERRSEINLKASIAHHQDYCLPDYDTPMQPEGLVFEDDIDVKSFCDQGVQCDDDPLLAENRELRKQVERLNSELTKCRMSTDLIKNNDARTKFYTGLPSFAVFMWLFNLLQSKAERMTYWIGSRTDRDKDRKRTSTGSLSLLDQFFCVLIRLKLGLFVTDISDRFNISEGTFSKYFTTWISLLSLELKTLNPFPSREIIDRTMPTSFKKTFPTVRVIIDCTELFIQRATSLVNQSMTFSNYKHHTTVKFLIGITPSGVISFVSEGWPGKTSDRQLTIESGIVELLKENDSVMADKGFTIKDVLAVKNCYLNIPPFRGNSAQFTTDEVFETQTIATLRIHVERSIGRVKKFHILDGVMPLTLQPLIDRIFQVCCWLTNLDVPLVS